MASRVQDMVFTTAFGSYQAQRVIGEGGTGRVYEVTDADGSQFAVKCLKPALMTTTRQKRFRNECLFCERNQHKNVIRVVEYGVATIKGESCPFYLMPYYPTTLRGLMREDIANKDALPLFSQILDGVEAAHKLGIYHRDLKPENTLYDPDSDVLVVSDFGVAHFAEEQLHTSVETRPGDRLANFQYAAPEQRERGRAVDHRADIYALGMMLNEMFTGSLPLGTNYTTIASVAPDYAYLDGLVESMMSQSPDERPASIEEVKKVLIGKQNEFVALQKLSQLKNRVIPASQIEDPLVTDPVRLLGLDYENGILLLRLSQPVSEKWIGHFHRVHARYALRGQDQRTLASVSTLHG